MQRVALERAPHRHGRVEVVGTRTPIDLIASAQALADRRQWSQRQRLPMAEDAEGARGTHVGNDAARVDKRQDVDVHLGREVGQRQRWKRRRRRRRRQV